MEVNERMNSMNKKPIRSRTIQQVALALGLGFVLLAIPGCGSSTESPVVPVAGKIAFANGQKLPAGTRLVFNPVEGRVGTAVGATAEDGTFQATHVTGAAGAEVGKYTVQLLPPEGNAGNFLKIVPKSYYEEAALFAEVKPGMPPLDFKVLPVR
jgi:hypothetical protein